MDINMDNIFGLFTSNEGLDGGDDTVYVNFKNTPVYWVGMYKKLILNHINFNKKIVKFFKEANEELDVSEVKEAGEFVVYNRAWSYIKDIDVDNKDHIDAIEKYCDEYLDIALKLGISFFEQLEEYEKCALLKHILDKSQKFSK
jgi:hypothetical protein|tara:strand:- start:974 stop:1405 length:432 start_codon:yes stop_codon:yes gene_type:complete